MYWEWDNTSGLKGGLFLFSSSPVPSPTLPVQVRNDILPCPFNVVAGFVPPSITNSGSRRNHWMAGECQFLPGAPFQPYVIDDE